MRVLVENRSAEAAESMFFPPLEGDSLSREVREVALGLELVVRRFGKVIAYEHLHEPVEVREFIVGTGQQPYWWRPDLNDRSVWFRVEFANVGIGIVRLNLVEKGSTVATASVAFGLLASRADACSIILGLTRAALEEFEQGPSSGEIEIDGC
jgi:hypothetical protein